jgi:hypothetical protein
LAPDAVAAAARGFAAARGLAGALFPAVGGFGARAAFGFVGVAPSSVGRSVITA